MRKYMDQKNSKYETFYAVNANKRIQVNNKGAPKIWVNSVRTIVLNKESLSHNKKGKGHI